MCNPTPLDAISEAIFEVFCNQIGYIERYGNGIEKSFDLEYGGIDVSIAPDLRGDEHDLAALLKLPGDGLEKWGVGTAAMIDAITTSLKSLPCKLTGYCGVMLPVLENESLAESASTGSLSVEKLLLYSNMCGVGLDTIPVQSFGNNATANEQTVVINRVAAVILDVAAISRRQKKPLSVRLLPVPGSRPGDPIDFSSPYLVNGKIMKI